MNTLNHYDGHRTVCTLEDKAIAARLGGHSWNIVNNSEQHEIYLPHARSSEHYVNKKGETTSEWFEKKKRVPHTRGGEGADASWSGDITRVLTVPRTPQAAGPAREKVKQLCQASAPQDYAVYSARRKEVMPSTPERPGHLERTLGENRFGYRDRITTPRISKVVDRSEWTPRRGEAPQQPRPPREEDMFTNVDQLRSESHFDVQNKVFAEKLRPPGAPSRKATPRGGRDSLDGSRESAVLAAASMTGRTIATPRHPADRVHFSKGRLENHANRAISAWTVHDDKLLRKDPFIMKPMQQANSSGVKHNIITNELNSFWY